MKLTFLRTWYGLNTKLYLPLKYMASFMLFFQYGLCCFRLLLFASEIKKTIFFLQRKREKESSTIDGVDILSSFLEKILLYKMTTAGYAKRQVQNFFQNP